MSTRIPRVTPQLKGVPLMQHPTKVKYRWLCLLAGSLIIFTTFVAGTTQTPAQTKKAEKAEKANNGVDILVDRSMQAHLPSNIISSVSNNALTWKEPIPAGYTELKPAKGITITVQKSIANRITILKYKENEI